MLAWKFWKFKLLVKMSSYAIDVIYIIDILLPLLTCSTTLNLLGDLNTLVAMYTIWNCKQSLICQL